jgi:hypothetical protein
MGAMTFLLTGRFSGPPKQARHSMPGVDMECRACFGLLVGRFLKSSVVVVFFFLFLVSKPSDVLACTELRNHETGVPHREKAGQASRIATLPLIPKPNSV